MSGQNGTVDEVGMGMERLTGLNRMGYYMLVLGMGLWMQVVRMVYWMYVRT